MSRNELIFRLAERYAKNPAKGGSNGKVGRTRSGLLVDMYRRRGTGRDFQPRWRRETNQRALLLNLDTLHVRQIARYSDGTYEDIHKRKPPKVR